MKTTRFIGILLVICLTLSIAAMPAYAFSDVDSGDWYYDAVEYCSEEGIMRGVSDDVFDPQGGVTRAMAATVIYRILGEHNASNMNNRFTDVPDGEWYSDAVKWMVYNTLIMGYGDGTFGPNDLVTKEQLATMLFRSGWATNIFPSERYAEVGFDDIDQCSDWAYPAVDRLDGVEVLSDLPGRMFYPQATATRAEMASMLYNYCIWRNWAIEGGYYEEPFLEDEGEEYWFEYAVFQIIYNECEETMWDLSNGMTPLLMGDSAVINGETCYKLVMGRIDEDGDLRPHCMYAVGLESHQVYRYNGAEDEWLPTDSPEWYDIDEG